MRKIKSKPPLTANQIRTLVKNARAVSKNAYSPYSKAKVGASLLLLNGKFVTGCNVENASFGATICAERTAVAKSISEFGNKTKIAAISVYSESSPPWTPCGMCLQVMSEFASAETPVILSNHRGEVVFSEFSDFMPYAFRF